MEAHTMRCPICRSQIWVMRLTESTYRIECVSICCDYVDEFEHVTGDLTEQAGAATVRSAGSTSHLP